MTFSGKGQVVENEGHHKITASASKDGTPMVGSPSKKQMRVRDMLQSFGNLFLVRLVIYYEFERV